MSAAGVLTAVTILILFLFLSVLGIFSLVSVSVSRQTREIGLRAALGARPRQVLAGILSHAAIVLGSGIAAGTALLFWFLVVSAWFSGQPVEDLGFIVGPLGLTAAAMLGVACFAQVSDDVWGWPGPTIPSGRC